MRPAFLLFLTVMGSASWSSLAVGQIVEVGPGYVRAPFVRVYRDPFGGAHVQAPFVDIYRPGRWAPHFPSPIGVQNARTNDLQQLNWSELAEAVRVSAIAVDRDLARLPSNDFWKTSLRTEDILSLMPSEQQGPPDESTRQQLQQILTAYESVGNDPEMNRVAALASFQNLRFALREYLSSPPERSRRQLAAATAELNRELLRFDTADTWLRYFALDQGGTLSAERLATISGQPTPDLAAMLSRFDTISSDERYPMIAGLPAFREVRDRLSQYLSESHPNRSVPPEELPTPRPDPPRQPGTTLR